MKTIYLIMEETLYGGAQPIKAFVSKEAAEAYVAGYNTRAYRYSVSVEEIMLEEE